MECARFGIRGGTGQRDPVPATQHVIAQVARLLGRQHGALEASEEVGIVRPQRQDRLLGTDRERGDRDALDDDSGRTRF